MYIKLQHNCQFLGWLDSFWPFLDTFGHCSIQLISSDILLAIYTPIPANLGLKWSQDSKTLRHKCQLLGHISTAFSHFCHGSIKKISSDIFLGISTQKYNQFGLKMKPRQNFFDMVANFLADSGWFLAIFGHFRPYVAMVQ